MNKTNSLDRGDKMGLGPSGRKLLAELLPLSGSEALNRILDLENPGQVIRKMTRVDLFWLIKKVGENDALPLLSLASIEQWQYILDMELWRRDRIDLNEMTAWLDKLHRADPERIARWLLSEEGNLPAHFYFYNVLQVAIKENDDFIIPKGFISFDDIYYIKILDKEHEEEIGQILRSIAREDYDRYHALLLGLGAMIPSEVQEEMYRFKSVRLAEDGYLPFQEAISVYSYQKVDLLKKESSEYKLYVPEDEESRSLVPVTPMTHIRGENLFTKSITRITDNPLLDRFRIEFAGLCNQIFSADGIGFEGIDALIDVSRKAAGYISIGLEKLSGGSIDTAEQYIINNPLVSIFRTGFGLALELKWRSDKWMKDSWFLGMGLSPDFWGDALGGLLKGVMKNKPLFFSGLSEENDYRDFKALDEIEECHIALDRLILFDGLLESITCRTPLDETMRKDPLLSFHPLIINFWARNLLDLEPGCLPLSTGQAKDLLGMLREGEKGVPYRMAGFKEAFIEDLVSLHTKAAPEDVPLLKDSLSQLWNEFTEEYARVEISDLDPRFTKFIMIEPSPGS